MSIWGFSTPSASTPRPPRPTAPLAPTSAATSSTSTACSKSRFGSDLCGNFVHEHSLLKEPLVQDGYAIVPTGPGLGVELDEEAVARYAISAQQWPG